MPSQPLPDQLTLAELPTQPAAQKRSSAPRAAEVILTGDHHFDELVYNIQNAAGAEVSLGRKPAIIVDKRKVFPISSVEKEGGLLYNRAAKDDKLQLVAVFTLRDAASRAKKTSTSQDVDMNDPALLALQQNLAQHKQMKESNS